MPVRRRHSTHPGEMIGPFKLIDVIFEMILTLDGGDGQLVRKSVDELTNHLAGPPPEAASAQTEAPGMPARVEPQTAKGPGGDGFNGSKLCQPNDSLPFGTVQDGLRKTEIKTPFGTTCLWDPAGK